MLPAARQPGPSCCWPTFSTRAGNTRQLLRHGTQVIVCRILCISCMCSGELELCVIAVMRGARVDHRFARRFCWAGQAGRGRLNNAY